MGPVLEMLRALPKLVEGHLLSICCPSPQNHDLVDLSSARLGENFPSWFTIPRKHLSSETVVGVFICRRASVLSGSAEITLSLSSMT